LCLYVDPQRYLRTETRQLHDCVSRERRHARSCPHAHRRVNLHARVQPRVYLSLSLDALLPDGGVCIRETRTVPHCTHTDCSKIARCPAALILSLAPFSGRINRLALMQRNFRSTSGSMRPAPHGMRQRGCGAGRALPLPFRRKGCGQGHCFLVRVRCITNCNPNLRQACVKRYLEASHQRSCTLKQNAVSPQVGVTVEISPAFHLMVAVCVA